VEPLAQGGQFTVSKSVTDFTGYHPPNQSSAITADEELMQLGAAFCQVLTDFRFIS
jgi:hypothetical protein